MRPVAAVVCLLALAACGGGGEEKPAEPPPVPKAKILITGFEPYDADGNGTPDENVSGDIVNDLKREVEDTGGTLGGHHIRTLVMPVRWGAPERLIRDKIKEIEAEGQTVAAIVGLGMTCAKGLEIETKAVNKREGSDVDGKPPPTDKHDPTKGEDAKQETSFTKEELDAMKAAAEATGADVKLDTTTGGGTFLCNETLWVSIGLVGGKAIFVHLQPYPAGATDDEKKAHRDKLKQAVKAIVEEVGKKI